MTVQPCCKRGAGIEPGRHSQVPDEAIHAAVASAQKHGFINYFGLQRFGTSVTPTHRIGLALLQGGLRGAVDLVLDPQASTRVSSHTYLLSLSPTALSLSN